MSRQTLFSSAANALKDTYWIVWIFVAVLAVFVAGLYFFFEDTYSSFVGIQQIQTALDIVIVSFAPGLYILAVTPQFAQVFFGMLAATQRYNANLFRMAVLFFLLIDVSFDVWYRSNEKLLVDSKSAIVSVLVTLVVYTLFSEVFILLGGGLLLELLPSFRDQVSRFLREMGSSKKPTYKSAQYKPNTSSQKPKTTTQHKAVYQQKYQASTGNPGTPTNSQAAELHDKIRSR